MTEIGAELTDQDGVAGLDPAALHPRASRRTGVASASIMGRDG
ncbi:hypothetical protein [Kribbella sp. NBC_00359]